MVQLMLLPPHHLLLPQNPDWLMVLSFWYRLTQVFLEEAVKWVSVCLVYIYCMQMLNHVALN